jgi:hypothetical protein
VARYSGAGMVQGSTSPALTEMTKPARNGSSRGG